ncbi:16169_t:CDS:2, partial [Funneliformis mosseae]
INYDRLIAASTDNTKLEKKLCYSASLGVILGSTLPLQETLVSSYNEIDTIVKKIQTNNTIAKYIYIYILQVSVSKVPLFVLEIIPNNSKNISDVYEIHNQVLELVVHFKIHILSIEADNASVEIKAQKCIMQTNTETKLEFTDELYNDEIRILINDAYKEANALAKCIFMVVTLNSELLLSSLTDFLTSDEIILPIEENLTKEFQNGEEILTEIVEIIGNIVSLNLQNNINEDLIYACE